MTQKHPQHVVLTNPSLCGLEYGMLRDFEDEIVRLTGAERVIAPTRSFPAFIGGRLAHGTRYSGARKWVPREQYELKADVLWVVLMGPESFTLDLYKGWDKHVGLKILYLFDTFEAQINSIRRVVSASNWDFVSTAFHGARPFLEQETQRQWHLVRQAVNLNRFSPSTPEERIIDFSAYGRRLDKLHEVVKSYCTKKGKYYDYTTAAKIQAQLDPREHYRQYAWHLSHSIFNFCWPVEVTHPERVIRHSPITCRWFEAAASGAVILGKAPSEPAFVDLFGTDAVIEVVSGEGEDLRKFLDDVWNQRYFSLQRATSRRKALSEQWTWESRIRQIHEATGLTFDPAAGEREIPHLLVR